MDIDLIKKLVKIVDTTGITDLEIEEGDLKIKIAKKVRSAQVITQPQIPANATQLVSHPTPGSGETQKQTTEAEPAAANLHEIRSPIVGTFYRALHQMLMRARRRSFLSVPRLRAGAQSSGRSQ